MITPILLFAFPALQEPAQEPNQEIVVELTEAQTEFLKHAQAWHTHPSFQLEGAISMSMDFGNGSTPLGTLSVNCQFMRIPLPNCEIPHQGFSNIDGTLSMMGMEQEIAMTFMSDGEGIWQIDHMEKIVFPSQLEEDDLAPIFPGLLPLEFWLNELKAKDVPAVEKVADKEKPKQYGLRCEMDGATITMWFNEAHEILSLSSVPGEGAMGMPEMDLAINSLSHSKKPDPKNFAYEIPEDYTRTTMEELMADMGDEGGSPSDFEASLLAVGTDAPDVQFTTMDGKEASLADYKGKQVLLNFWFYH